MSEVSRDDPTPAAWLFVAPEQVPDRWRGRAKALLGVPLLPDEADRLLAEGGVTPGVVESDEAFLGLVGSGLPPDELARRCGLSLRSVHRRLAALRNNLGVRSTAELVATLAARGFSDTATRGSATGAATETANDLYKNPEGNS